MDYTRISDDELKRMHKQIGLHIRWRKEHQEQLLLAEFNKRCVCGRNIGADNELIDRGYTLGIECKKCKN